MLEGGVCEGFYGDVLDMLLLLHFECLSQESSLLVLGIGGGMLLMVDDGKWGRLTARLIEPRVEVYSSFFSERRSLMQKLHSSVCPPFIRCLDPLLTQRHSSFLSEIVGFAIDFRLYCSSNSEL
jgi:hypothetical protein